MSVADEIAKLQDLHRAGALTDEEFAAAKQRLISGDGGPTPTAASSFGPSPSSTGPPDLARRATEVRQWAMFIHLSQLLSFLVPFSGIVAPIVIWQIKRTEMPEIEVHGKNVANWLISYAIYMAICIH